MKIKLLLCIVALLISSLIVIGCGTTSTPSPTTKSSAPASSTAPSTSQTTTTAQPGQTIILKGITGLPRNAAAVAPVGPWVESMNKQSKGIFQIQWLGGPEVITTFDQANALRTGVVDMLLMCPPEYLEAVSPAGIAQGLSKTTPWEERKNGVFDIWVEYYAKSLNARYLGRVDGDVPYLTFVNKPVQKIGDFKGLILRVSPLYEPMTKALGAKPVTIALPEVYTAMERGTIDGLLTAAFGLPNFGLQSITKFMVYPEFFQTSGGRFINTDSWNKLPKESQDLIAQSMLQDEHTCLENSRKTLEENMKITIAAGVKRVDLPPADGQQFLEIAYGSTWDYIISKSPDYGPKLKKAFGQ